MEWQLQVLQGLSKELSLSLEDKGQLFEDDEKGDSKQSILDEINRIGLQDDTDEQLAQLQKSFFQSLKRVHRIQEVSELFSNDSHMPKDCQLVQSVVENQQFIEDNVYVKLVKQLKEQIRFFETPLESMPEFLTFLKVTMKILRDKSREHYSFMINELIKSRARYIDLSFQENVALIFAK